MGLRLTRGRLRGGFICSAFRLTRIRLELTLSPNIVSRFRVRVRVDPTYLRMGVRGWG